jgi:hypothetical protein
MYEPVKRFAQKYQSRSDAQSAIDRATKKYNNPSGIYEIIEEKAKSKSKYNATRCWVEYETGKIYDSEQPNSIAFDSIFEARVYQVLTEHNTGYIIGRQHPLLIKPETQLYKRLEWCVDFYVYSNTLPKAKHLYIEAKGLSQPEFIRNLQYFQFFNQADFDKLIVVTEDSRKIDRNIKSIGFREFKDLARLGLLVK